MKIAIANDHAAVDHKFALIKLLESEGHEVINFGTNESASCDYPDFAHALANAMARNEVQRGIAICGSGEGISMALNKHQHIRAALVWIPEIAKMTRLHNDANVLVMPGRYIDTNLAEQIMTEFLNTEFEGGRHINRVNKIAVN
jgi:ribose 5-phosphate isomerase B